jgi:hypothetical protein
VKVRVQARDGKILGPAPTVKQPLLSVRDVHTKKMWITDKPFDKRSSGTVVPASEFGYGVSRNAIVVEPFDGPIVPTNPPHPPSGPYWLQPPGKGQGELIVELPLTDPALLEFTAKAYAPDEVYASATMWVVPGMELLDDPGLVLTIAGLYVTATASGAGGLATVTATVTMMCGCPITAPVWQTPPANEELYWPANEFEVTARFRKVSTANQSGPYKMTFAGTNTFTLSQQLPTGLYVVSVVAVQRKETNVGFASTTVDVS